MNAKEFAEKHSGKIVLYKGQISDPPYPLDPDKSHRVMVVGYVPEPEYVVVAFIDNPSYPGWHLSNPMVEVTEKGAEYGWLCLIQDLTALETPEKTQEDTQEKNFKLLEVD